MAFCIGPFCGKFRDELGDSDSDDDDGTNMRAKTKGKAKRKRPKKDRTNVASTNMMWPPYLSEVRVLVKGRSGAEEMKAVTQLKTPYNQNLTENMLNRINQLHQVEIIEISKCNLQKIPPSLEELEGLFFLVLSYNNIRKFSAELARCEALERIVLDWNQIGEIEPGIFSDTTFQKLEVINLSHNRLTFLPTDFPRTAAKALRYVDLSYNQLTSVPSELMQCRELRELNLSHNRLSSLPEKYELKRLKKLFLSFNELVSLPEDIGISEKLEKLRITSNQIKRLPFSILKLWKNASPTGRLEELLVDRNPLQVPSITAFEMESGTGGMNRALELLQWHQKEAEEEMRQRTQLALKDQEAQLALPTSVAEVKTEELELQPAAEDQMAHLDPWYFGHCLEDQEKIAAIRDAEQSYLVRKRHLFLEQQRRLTQDEKDNSRTGLIKPEREVFLDEQSYQKYRGRIKTEDLDIFHIHFIMTAKQTYGSATEWFRRFVPDKKSYMTKQEWYELCLNSKLDVRQKMMDDLWADVYDEKLHPHGLPLTNFIAAAQIHDIEARDPFIIRIADALCLDYFETTINTIEAASAPNDSVMAPNHAGVHQHLTDELVAPIGLKPAAEPLAVFSGQVSQSDKRDSVSELKDILKKVSLTEYDCQQLNNLEGIEERSVAESEKSEDSAELSDDAASEMTEFDAQAFLLEELEQSHVAAAKAPSRFTINSDAALRQLMQAPLSEIFRGRAEAQRATEPPEHFKRQVLNKPQNASRTHSGELAVRRAIRDVYRNMPFHEFSSFISFLLRQLHAIKEDKGASPTMWHDDEPAFRHAVGAAGHNKYTCRLLEIMGFVHLNDKYWIWPVVHLKSGKHGKTWAHLQVPADCPGMVRARLEHMINVLAKCLVAINEKGTAFTGYFDPE